MNRIPLHDTLLPVSRALPPQDVLSVADPTFSEKMAQHLHRSFFRPAVLGGLVEALSESESGAGGAGAGASAGARAAAAGDRDVAPSMAGEENGMPGGAVVGEREPEVCVRCISCVVWGVVLCHGFRLVLPRFLFRWPGVRCFAGVLLMGTLGGAGLCAVVCC